MVKIKELALSFTYGRHCAIPNEEDSFWAAQNYRDDALRGRLLNENQRGKVIELMRTNSLAKETYVSRIRIEKSKQAV